MSVHVPHIHSLIYEKPNSSSLKIIIFLFQPWCSTEVDETGHHKGGRGKWGNCGPGCPIPPDDREASVVVPDTEGRRITYQRPTQDD